MKCGLTLRLAKAAYWIAGVAIILSYIGIAPEARAEEHWQYSNTRRVDIGGLAFAHRRPILYVSFSYRGTDGTVLAPSAVVGIDLETGKAITDVLPRGTSATDPVISPDDAYLAYRFYDKAHLIGLRRLADGQMSVLPDKLPGIKYPQFFSPDSKTLSYRIGEDPEDPNYDRRSEDSLTEYSLDTGKRTAWSLGVAAAWDLQRLSDDRVIFRAINPTDKEVLRQFAPDKRDFDFLYVSSLIYTFDKTTGTVSVDPLNRLSAPSDNFTSYAYRHFRTIQGAEGRRYYVLDKGYKAADLLAGDQRELKRIVHFKGSEVLDFVISDDEKWLAYVYSDVTKDRFIWRDGGYDEDLEIRNMVTGETRRIDLREPPFSDVANQQRLAFTSGLVAWLGSPPFDDVEPAPPVVDSTLVRQIILALIGLATLVVWVGAGVVCGTWWNAVGVAVTGTLFFAFVIFLLTIGSAAMLDPYDYLGVALIFSLLGYLLPIGAVVAAVTSLISNFIRRRRAQQEKA